MRDTVCCRSRIVDWRWLRGIVFVERKRNCRSGNRSDRNSNSACGAVSVDLAGDTGCDLKFPLAFARPSSYADVLSSVVLLITNWSG